MKKKSGDWQLSLTLQVRNRNFIANFHKSPHLHGMDVHAWDAFG